MIRTRTGKRLLAAAICVLLGSGSVHAQSTTAGEQSGKRQFDVVAGPLADALSAFISQAGVELVYRLEDVDGLKSTGVQGFYTDEEALQMLLRDTRLRLQKQPSGALAIVPETPARSNESAAGRGEVEEVMVLGTNIRGAAPDSSPVHVYDQGDIRRSGAATTQEFIRMLPQNFGGGSNAALVRGTPYDDASSDNVSLGSSVNLRGLGSGATLVLVNGQRLAPSSSIGDFVDISMIPLNAIERVEVLTDGASAIYGGDAVAGVVNFVLKDEYEGAESYASYGSVTEGSMAEVRAGQTFGGSWSSGRALISYDYHKQDSLSVLDRDFSASIGRPIDLLPQQERHSVLLSATQEIGLMEAHVDALYGARDAKVTRSNTETTPTRTTIADAEQLSLIAGIRGDLPGGWYLESTAAFSEVENATDTPGIVGGGVAISRTSAADQWSAEVKVSGSLLQAPGGDVKVAAGAGFRNETFESVNRVLGVKDRQGERDVSYAFAEMLMPFFGPSNQRPGLRRLELNLSARGEDYDDFGTTFNPKAGLVWSPLRGLNLRATYGTSFNPPDLGRIAPTDTEAYIFTNDIINSLLEQSPEIPSSVPALLVLGTDPDLDPEESDAWTAGFDFTAPLGNGRLSTKATYFDIEFKDRINVVQVPGGSWNVFNIGLCCSDQLPAGTVVIDPSPSEVSEVIAQAQSQVGFFDQFGLYDGNPESVGLIAYLTKRNLAMTRVRGLDFEASYSFDVGNGALAILFNGNYLFEFANQSSSTTPVLDQVDTIFRPVDLRLRGGLTWSSGRWSSALFVNYTDSYVDDRPQTPVELESWTTVDMSIGYTVPDSPDSGWLSNLRVDLAASNLFDKQPPYIGADFQLGVLGYDPANADARGRFISLRVTKGW